MDNKKYHITQSEMNEAIKMFSELEEESKSVKNKKKRVHVSLKSMTPEEKREHRRLQTCKYAEQYRKKQKEKYEAQQMFIELTQQELEEQLNTLEELKKKLGIPI